MSRPRPIRVLMAKVGLDGHDVGVKIVCRALIEAGMEVIYTGLRKSPAEVARMAADEDVDVLGLSILSGAHVPLCERLALALEREGMKGRVLWLAGGNIPARDHAALKNLGVQAVFPTGSPFEAIVGCIEDKVNHGEKVDP